MKSPEIFFVGLGNRSERSRSPLRFDVSFSNMAQSDVLVDNRHFDLV